ncbi:MAG: GNAT family N-acetyltransferase [Gammaproteobacteria bacterium]|nr:GNAT family N-acetyltransferase [Gammaproteobacteria bacterium]
MCPAEGSSTTARIRRARIDDVAMLAQLEQRFPTDRLSRTSLRGLLRRGHASVRVCEQDNVLAGNAVVLYRRGSAIARLYSLVVHPDYLRRGIGRMLLAAAEAASVDHGCRELRLEVRPDNLPAIQLYRKAGYVVTDKIGKFYEDGTDALRMSKRLGPVTGAPAGRSRRQRPAPAAPGATA